MKRITYWPQVFLGFTFNYGGILGWTAIQGSLSPILIPFYCSCVSWTIFYDTIYAHQDREDDTLIGMKSTAIFFGENTKKWLIGFAGITTLGFVVTGLVDGTMSWPFYFIVIAIGGTHLSWQILKLNINRPDICSFLFRSNKWYGAIIFLAILAGKLCSSNNQLSESHESLNLELQSG